MPSKIVLGDMDTASFIGLASVESIIRQLFEQLLIGFKQLVGQYPRNERAQRDPAAHHDSSCRKKAAREGREGHCRGARRRRELPGDNVQSANETPPRLSDFED